MVLKMSVVQNEILFLLIISERPSRYDFNDIMGMPLSSFLGEIALTLFYCLQNLENLYQCTQIIIK